MTRTWSKLPHGLPTSPIWQAIAEEAETTPAVACQTYLHLHDFISQVAYHGGGAGGLRLTDIACFLDVADEVIECIWSIFVARRLIVFDEAGRFGLADWMEPMPGIFPGAAEAEAENTVGDAWPKGSLAKAPSAHALRNRRYRARKKAAKAAEAAAGMSLGVGRGPLNAAARDGQAPLRDCGERLFERTTGSVTQGITRDVTRDALRDARDAPPCTEREQISTRIKEALAVAKARGSSSAIRTSRPPGAVPRRSGARANRLPSSSRSSSA